MTYSEKDLHLIEYDNNEEMLPSSYNNNDSRNLTTKSPSKNLAPESEDRGVEIISIALDLGNGSQAVFSIHENDYPEQVAKEVCSQYRLPAEYEQKITAYILDRIDEIVLNNYQDDDGLEQIPEYNRRPNAGNNSHLRQPLQASSGSQHGVRDLSSLSPDQHMNHALKSSQKSRQTPTQDSYISYWNEELKKLRESDKAHAIKHPDKNKKIYEKLFEEGNYKNNLKSHIEKKVMADKVRSPAEIEGWKRTIDDPRTIDVCNRLYTVGVRERERKKNFIKQKQQEHDEVESYELKFKPNLNLTESKNKDLLKNKDKTGYDRLINWKMQNESKIYQTTKHIEEQHQTEYHFQPEINRTSRAIMERAQASVNKQIGREEAAPFNRHEQLYYDACQRQKRKEEIICNFLPEEYTFHPNLGQSKFKIHDSIDQQDLVQRLQSYTQRKEENVSKMAKEQNRLTDEKGQKMFKPQINNYKLDRNVANVDIGEYLYSQKDMIESKRSEAESRLNKQIESQQTSKKTNKASESMFESRKQKKFAEIFAALDGDGDGVISADNIDIDRINPGVLTIINELLIEMEEKGKSLDSVSFCAGMFKFYDYLAPSERQNLLSLRTLQDQTKPLQNHKPEINPISKVLAENLRRNDGISTIKKKWEERKNKYLEDQKNKENEDYSEKKTLSTKRSNGNIKTNNTVSNNKYDYKDLFEKLKKYV